MKTLSYIVIFALTVTFFSTNLECNNWYTFNGEYEVENVKYESWSFTPIQFKRVGDENKKTPKVFTIVEKLSKDKYQISYDSGFSWQLINNETIEFANIDIYPNPAQDAIYLSLKWKNTNNRYTIMIYDANGNKQRILSFDENDKIDVSGLNHGVYTLQLFSNEKKVGQQIFIKY